MAVTREQTQKEAAQARANNQTGVGHSDSAHGAEFPIGTNTRGNDFDPDPKDGSHTRAMRTFASGATRDAADDKPDYLGYISHRATKRFGEYMLEHQRQADGSMRASDNWKKGIPVAAYKSSLARHVRELEQMHEKMQDGRIIDAKVYEDTLAATWFNVQGLLHECLKLRGA